MSKSDIKIAIIGLGYVGLPLAVEFAKKYQVIGFDINQNRIEELEKNNDSTLEIKDEVISSVRDNLNFTSNINDTKDCNIYIVCVPTPIDEFNKPNLEPLISSSKSVGTVIKKNDIIIYESTVYPGVTEDVCVKELEKSSGLKFNIDFFCGYSPERVNPGDKVNTLTKIKKITSGSTPEIAEKVDQLYKSIITAGTHKASSIRVAEAAKVIENSQRDINIAFVNELSVIFNRLGIDTHEVLEAAGTKWNFLPFVPGLVGGHCIGVDPYYLAQKAQELGYHPEIILAGRRMNDSMGQYVASEVVKLMIQKDLAIKGAKVLILGITFKENCPDVRNTRVIDVVESFKEFGTEVTICDPWANKEEVLNEYGVEIVNELPKDIFDALVLTVAHKEFIDINCAEFIKPNGVVYDVKGVLGCDVDGRL